jgi:hypothetical protein
MTGLNNASDFDGKSMLTSILKKLLLELRIKFEKRSERRRRSNYKHWYTKTARLPQCLTKHCGSRAAVGPRRCMKLSGHLHIPLALPTATHTPPPPRNQ